MTLGETLRGLIPKSRTHKSVAMAWLEALQQRAEGTADWQPDTVVSQFSRLMNDEPAGIKFFFTSRDHATVLLDAIKVAPAERESIIGLADAALAADGTLPPRLVVDLTGYKLGRDHADRLFDELETWLIKAKPIAPVTLLLSNALFKVLPRTFDRESAWLRWETIDDPNEAAERTKQLAGDQALVASPQRIVPVERWLAIGFEGHRLELEPLDGVEVFARAGALALPEVAHDLAAVVDALTLPRPHIDLNDGPSVRRLIVNLRTEATADNVTKDPRWRLAAARALGVVATSTERDRIEFDLEQAVRKLGREIKVMSPAELDERVARAKRRPIEPEAVRCGDEVHVINPGPEQAGLEHPRVRVHRIDAATPALQRLQQVIESRSLAEWEADPFLLQAIEQLDPDGTERIGFLYARASLLWDTTVDMKPLVPIDDWRGTLVDLFAHDPPSAKLRVPQTWSQPRYQERERYVMLHSPQWMAEAAIASKQANFSNALRFVPSPLTHVTIDRRLPPLLMTRTRREPPRYGIHDRTDSSLVQIDLCLPNDVRDLGAVDAWLNLAEWISTGQWLNGPAEKTRNLSLDLRSETNDIWMQFMEIDRELAFAWVSLRAAVVNGPAARMPDGTAMLSLGGTLVAEIDARIVDPKLNESHVVASFDVNIDGQNSRIKTRIESGVHDLVFDVPIGLVITGAGVRASIRFTTSPLLLGNVVQSPAVAAGRSATSRRNAARDDDGDD